MSPSPIREDSHPSPTVSSPLTTAATAIARASSVTRPVLPLPMPSSTICCTSSGVTITMPASRTVSARKTEISRRCGRANAKTRRTVPRSTRLWTIVRSERRWRQAGPIPCMPDKWFS